MVVLNYGAHKAAALGLIAGASGVTVLLFRDLKDFLDVSPVALVLWWVRTWDGLVGMWLRRGLVLSLGGAGTRPWVAGGCGAVAAVAVAWSRAAAAKAEAEEAAAFGAAVRGVPKAEAEAPAVEAVEVKGAAETVEAESAKPPLRSVRKGLARLTGLHGVVSGKAKRSRVASDAAEEQLVIAGRWPYHEASGLEATAGYCGCLTAGQQRALAEVLTRTEALHCERHLAPHGETVETLALRFLRARGFDVAKASAMLAADVSWRDSVCDLARLRLAAPEAVAGLRESAPPDALSRCFPMWIEGCDGQGRPVFYKPFASWKLDELVHKHGATPASLVAYLTYAQDRCFHFALGRASLRAERAIEQVVVVLDARDLRWAWGLKSRDGVKITRAMVKLDADHYPERLGSLYIINAGKVFSKGWALISKVVDSKTKKKIHILNGPEDYVPALRAAIGEDMLAKEYGGRGVARTTRSFYDPITANRRRSSFYSGTPRAQGAAPCFDDDGPAAA